MWKQMKKVCLIAAMLLIAGLMSSCSSSNDSYGGANGGSDIRRSLEVSRISYNLGASVFETQYVYEVADMEFDGNFSEESKSSFRASKYVVTDEKQEKGDQLWLGTYASGDICVTVGERVLDLRPKAVDAGDTYIVYGFRHTFKDHVQLVESKEKLYNVIWECAKELVLIEYTYA